MKSNRIKLVGLIISCSILSVACKKSDTTVATVYYQQQDQMGRPAINTVFNVSAADKDAFNVTTPSAMSAAFQAKFQARLVGLYPGYTTNLLTLTPAQFTGILATDVLNVSTTGPTTFYDGVAANTLSGRALADDAIDVELILIFGGPTNAVNPTLTSDHVNANDKAFSASFPYEAVPW